MLMRSAHENAEKQRPFPLFLLPSRVEQDFCTVAARLHQDSVIQTLQFFIAALRNNSPVPKSNNPNPIGRIAGMSDAIWIIAIWFELNIAIAVSLIPRAPR